MPSQKNIQELEVLKEKVSRAKALALTNYAGLSVSQLTRLRAKVREAGGELRVTKNTLLKLALNNEKIQQSGALTGPTLTLFAYGDEIMPLKAVVEFAKENELPVLKAGFWGKDFLTAEALNSLASLPSREELHAKVVSQLAAPISGFVNVLTGTFRSFVYVLRAIEESKN